MSWNYHFWARFWPNFNFVDFRAYFGPFSLVKRAKNKIAFLQQKKCSNKKSEENKPTLKFNFLWKSKCASLYFQFWVLGANLDEPYYASTFKPFAFDDRLAAPSLILASFTVIIWQESPANQDYKIAEQPPITLQLVFSLTTCKELWAGSCLVI